MKQSIGFIGGGRVTRILLQAFKNRNVEFSKTIVADTNKDVTDKLKKAFPGIQVEPASVAAAQDMVFISLHPPVIIDILELLKSDFKSSATVISLAPKITIAKIASKLIGVKNIVRLIPNATSFINEGFNPVCFSDSFSGKEKKEVTDLLGKLGKTFEVPEGKLESYAIMSAMLPTYFWFQWKVLAEIGQEIGLSEEECRVSINETLLSAIDLMYKSGLSAADVIDLIPVKPIGEHESQINEIYWTKLTGLYEKIRPQ
jgi:pyrroline-5-carboxylate reductase